MTEVFINIVSGEGGPTLRSIYENVSKNNLFAMFARVNLSMIVATFLCNQAPGVYLRAFPFLAVAFVSTSKDYVFIGTLAILLRPGLLDLYFIKSCQIAREQNAP